jgi:LysM repeat protein
MKLAPFALGLAVAAFSLGTGAQSIKTPAPTKAASAVKTAAVKVNQASKEKKFVIVNEGDTLDAIATQNGTTYVRLFDANPDIQDPNIINPGDKVRIPDADEQLPDRALPEVAAPVAQTSPVTTPQTTYSAPVRTPISLPTGGGAVAGCGDNTYANFIYSHESGCRTTAMSPNGCYGIGQACPASKISYCGADYACQNAFFTAYAAKYGGWAGAYAFWVAHGWW